MDETGNLLSSSASRKYVIHNDDGRKYRGAATKRTLVTSVECISMKGRYLSPMIIWPGSTHRSDWTIHQTPGWHFACSPTGYSNTAIVLDWYRKVFDPQTKERAGHRPRGDNDGNVRSFLEEIGSPSDSEPNYPTYIIRIREEHSSQRAYQPNTETVYQSEVEVDDTEGEDDSGVEGTGPIITSRFFG